MPLHPGRRWRSPPSPCRLALSLAAVIGVAGCGGGGSGGDAPAGGGSLPVDFTSVGNPLTVAPRLAAAGAASEVIPATGGALSVTTPDGSSVTLVIPPGALLADTAITMTPLAAVDGLPFSGGLVAGVQLEPEGLRLLETSQLVIEPARPVPPELVSPFAYSGAGDDFRLHWSLPVPGVVLLPVFHFSGYGVAWGPAFERNASRPTASIQARLEQGIAVIVSDLKAGRISTEAGHAELQAIFEAYSRDVIQAHLDAAQDCAAVEDAVAEVLNLQRIMNLMGMDRLPDALSATSQGFWDAIVAGQHRCIDEAYAHCVAHRLEPIYPAVLGSKRTYALFGLPDDAYGEDAVTRCFSFTLVVDSAVTGAAPTYQATIHAEVPLRMAGLLDKVHGSASYAVTAFSFDVPGCTTDTTSQGGVLAVPQLDLIPGPPVLGLEFPPYRDVQLRWDPTADSHTIRVQCPQSPPADLMPAPFWYPVIAVLHEPELLPDLVFFATDWLVSGGRSYAQKSWSRSSEDLAHEETTLLLLHTPGE